MVVDRGHAEHPLAGALEPEHLDDDAGGLHHEQPADDQQHDLVVRGDRDRAERAAEREAAGIAHEHRRRRRVEPQEGEPRAHDPGAQDRQLARARHVRNAEVGRIVDAADEVGDDQQNAPAAMTTGIVASPSSPSVRFTALPKPTITNAANT